MGSCWCHTTRGVLPKAREETERALKHAKRAGRYGFESAVDRYAKDKVYATRMDSNGVDHATMQEWGSLPPIRRGPQATTLGSASLAGGQGPEAAPATLDP